MKHHWVLYAALSLVSIGNCAPPFKKPKLKLHIPFGQSPYSSPKGASIQAGPPGSGNRPSVVWRGDSRTPLEIEESGGFYGRGVKMELTGAQAEEASSLYEHALHNSAEFSNYVSTSTDPFIAQKFAAPNELSAAAQGSRSGTLYKISADPKMVDLKQCLGKQLPNEFRGEMEQSIVKGAPWEQVEGWYNAKDLGSIELERIKSGETLEKLFIRNENFNAAKYGPLRGAGSQPQLAGFEKTSSAWNEEPWIKYKGQSVAENLEKYYREAGCGGAVTAAGFCDFTTEATAEVATGAEGAAESAATEEGTPGEAADLVGDKDLLDQIEAGEVTEGRLFALDAAGTELEGGVAEATLFDAANVEAAGVVGTLDSESIAATVFEGGEGITAAGELLEVIEILL